MNKEIETIFPAQNLNNFIEQPRTKMKIYSSIAWIALPILSSSVLSFTSTRTFSNIRKLPSLNTSSSLSSTTSSSSPTEVIEENVLKLKKVLEREYTTFFNPMYTNYYSKDVTFTDPMTTLSGVQAYQNNVDMLASRTGLGKFLFKDASISLHSVTGGEVGGDNIISDIVTRWTLRLSVPIIPWKPTARFTGISIYKVQPTNDDVGVSITGQIDYWDSVNIKPNSNGEYMSVETGVAVNDFLDQLKPNGFQAQTAAPELPYQLLRRGDGYEGECQFIDGMKIST